MCYVNTTAVKIYNLIFEKLADKSPELARELGQAFNELMDQVNEQMEQSGELMRRLVRELQEVPPVRQDGPPSTQLA